jgi:hypothetical protein
MPAKGNSRREKHLATQGDRALVALQADCALESARQSRTESAMARREASYASAFRARFGRWTAHDQRTYRADPDHAEFVLSGRKANPVQCGRVNNPSLGAMEGAGLFLGGDRPRPQWGKRDLSAHFPRGCKINAR